MLKKFVAEKDSSFKFEIVERRNVGKSTAIRLHLVSQSWKEVTWKHVLWIAVPNKLIAECKAAADAKQQPVKTNGLLFITGGAWAKEWGDTALKKTRILVGKYKRFLQLPSVELSGSVVAGSFPADVRKSQCRCAYCRNLQAIYFRARD